MSGNNYFSPTLLYKREKMRNSYLPSIIKQLAYYRLLGQKTFDQLDEEALFKQVEEANSIAIIVNHLSGNMLSRWTDFLISDGEKPWRKRDQEFEDLIRTRAELQEKWDKGWDCLFMAIKNLKEKDLEKIVYIRNMGHTVFEAINRQLAHYAYHVGQIVFIGKMIKRKEWQSLSIPKGESQAYNIEKFSKEKKRQHFSDEFLKGKPGA